MAEAKHTQALRSLATSVAGEAPNVRLIRNNLKAVNLTYEDLVEKHVSYVLKIGATLETDQHSHWLDAKTDAHSAGVLAAETTLGLVDPEDSQTRDLGELKEELQMLTLGINAEVANLTVAINQQMTPDQHTLLSRQVLDLQKQVETEYRDLAREIRNQDVENRAELETTHNNYLAEKIPEVRKLITDTNAKKPGPMATHRPADDVPVAGVADRAGARGSRDDRRQAKLKPISAPVFSGKAQDYAQFKMKFQEMVEPFFDQSSQLEYLESGLPAKVKDRMSLVRKTPVQIWDQLDEWFNDPKVLLRESMSALHGLKKTRLNHSDFMIKLCNTLVDTETLLDGIGQGDYLRHPRELAELEDLLPHHEAQELIRRSNRFTGNDYEKYHKFLVERRTELEKLARLGTKGKTDLLDKSENRSAGGDQVVCEKCGGRHKTQDCWKGGKGTKTCYKCGEEGHFKSQCVNTLQRKKRGGQTDGADTGPGDQTGKREDIHSNAVRPSFCNRCKNCSNLSTPCPGCAKTGSGLTHCLLHCPTFSMEGVKGKVEIVKKSNVCVVCLGVNHQSDKCRFKDNDKSICGLGGCKRHHHPSLHGSTDTYITSVATLRVEQVDIKTPGVSSQVFQRYVNKQEHLRKVQDSSQATELEKRARAKEWDDISKMVGLPMLDGDKVLLILQEIWMVYGLEACRVLVNSFFDPGSTCSLILTSVAEKYGLQGQEVKVTITTVNGEKDRITKLYIVELVNMDGSRRIIRALGMDKISDRIPNITLEGVKHHFSQEVQERWETVTRRPCGEVELLIGSEAAGLHPVKYESKDDLVVMKSEFGEGWIIYGSHPDLGGEHLHFSDEVGAIRTGGFKLLPCGRISCTQNLKYSPVEVEYLPFREGSYKQKLLATNPRSFDLIEDLGVEPPRRCSRCRGCKDCSYRGMRHSEREAEEYKLIEEGVKYCQETGKYQVSYPFIEDPYKLGNNVNQVMKIAMKEEKKLDREGLTEQANKEFEKMVSLGALRKISQVELDSWKGPRHYVSIQHVLNPGSNTTPLRLVTNSSLRDPRSGLSVNDVVAKGPNYLSDTYDLLIRFRGYLTGLIADVTKAYYVMSTGLVEMHLRRVVWRHGDVTKEFDTYGFLVVSFGDRPAAVLLEIVIRITVQMFGDIDKMAGKKLVNDRFVDDLVTGGEKLEVSRYIGVEDPDTLQCSGTMPQILAAGGIKLKAMAYSGEKDGDKLKKLGSAVLGLGYSTEKDTLTVRLRANVSPKKRGSPTQEDLTVETLHLLEDCQLTRKLFLSVCNSVYDVLGIVAPITIQAKVINKKLFAAEYNLGWDTILPEDLQTECKEFITMLVKAEDVSMIRSLTPAKRTGDWVITCFFDGSETAFACVLYAVWQVENGPADVRFITSKARVAPDWSKNTPRMELNAALLSTRILLRVVRALESVPVRVYIAGDSETILAAKEKHSGYFNEYFSNRIGEIIENEKKITELCPIGMRGEWYHVASKDNPADRPTRTNSMVEDIVPGSDWQEGPNYLKKPPSDWPFDREFAERKGKQNIPVEEIAKKYRELLSRDKISPEVVSLLKQKREEEMIPEDRDNPILKMMNYGQNTNSWEKLLRQTGMMFKWLVRTVQNRTEGAIITERNMAQQFWIRSVMSETRKALEKGQLAKLTVWEHEGIIVVTGRAELGLKKFYGVNYLPVIMSYTRVVQLIMLWAHERDHSNSYQQPHMWHG